MKDDIFLAYDIRGRNISTHDSYLIGRALGSVFSGSCIVGRDTRASSPELLEHLIEGLRSSGIKIINIGLVPNPVCYYAVYKKHDFGVLITGSHLPAEYNGYKIILKSGASIDAKSLQKVKESFYKFKFKKGMGGVRVDITALNNYAKFLSDNFSRMPVKCVIDCFNASSSVLSKRVFSNLLAAKVLNDQPLPDFGGRAPEPSDYNLDELKREVVKTKSSFGVGFDGDGDRSVFVDEEGNYIDGSKMTMLFSKYVLKNNRGGIIVVPVSVSSKIEDVVKEFGGKVVWCKVGHTFIEETILENNALFGGEFSSHFFWNQFYPFSDGSLSTIMLAKIIHESGKKLSELVGELPRVFVMKEEIEFPTHKAKRSAMERIKQDLLKTNPDALKIDGIKFSREGSSILVRASETRHTVKVFTESETKEKAAALLKEYVSFIEGYIT